MLYVTVDMSADKEDWHLKVLERLTKGIQGLERDGFKVERYQEFTDPQKAKWILTISRANSGGGDSLEM